MANNPNKGALFKNDKQGNEKRPDYTGSCNVGDVEYRISAWVNESQGGKKYLSLKFQLPDQNAGGQQQGQQAAPQQMRRPAPQQARRAEQPFGDEQQFKEADIPF